MPPFRSRLPYLATPFLDRLSHTSRDECVLHVQKALEMAVSRDGASGGLIRMCVATGAGVERWTVAPDLLQQRRETGRASGDGGG